MQDHAADFKALGATEVTATGVDSLRLTAPPTTDRILHDVLSSTIKGVNIEVPVDRSGQNTNMPPRPTGIREAVELISKANLPGVSAVMANSTRYGEPSIVVQAAPSAASGLNELLRDSVASVPLTIQSA